MNSNIVVKILSISLLIAVLGLTACNNGGASDGDEDGDNTDSLNVDNNNGDNDGSDENIGDSDADDNSEGDEEETSPEQAELKKAIENIVTAVNTDDNATLASAMLYKGKDELRAYNEAMDFSNPDDEFTVIITLATIQEWSKGSTHSFGEYTTFEDEFGKWYIQQATFNKGEGLPKTVYFSFKKVGDKYLMGDMTDSLPTV